MTDIYITQGGIAESVGNSDFITHGEKLNGLLLDPDILIGERPGWTPHRAVLYKQYRAEGRLAEEERPDWWYVPEPIIMLKSGEAAVLLGVAPVTITMSKQRSDKRKKTTGVESFPTPEARITHDPANPGPRDTFGWTRETLIRYGKGIGWLDKDGRIANLRGGGPTRKVFTGGQEAA